ncbi:hypothetical protein GH5_01127 [Leishmania sp. Ghana 2012 LV757]|uniref:hypothetical protein n=1 Tax=Leishmania sp. Ghana 2012 LV757 TaxID=2803181 RepID=UPI001B490771|nr:hypothetical protein GH5_01127 [Leishmania sp. Ghana 2012 LV757]
MALDFDVDDAPTFDELVRDARHGVMQNREMAACWLELADQHTFFKDIAKEGRARGESLGAVLAAMQGICQAVQRVELSNSEVEAPSPACTAAFSSPARRSSGGSWPDSQLKETWALAQVVRAYLGLYCSTPIPTRAQWASSLQPLFPESTNEAIASRWTVDAGAVHPTPALSTLGRYLTQLRQTVGRVTQELPDSDSDEKDGSFAAEELKELVLCCIAVGRRVARSTTLPHLDARLVREMVTALQDFVGSSTLEW